METGKSISGQNSGAHIEIIGGVPTAMDGNTFHVRAWFPQDHIGFQGHFPDYPLLPGFLHIELVLDVLRHIADTTLLPGKIDLAQVHNAKFLRPIQPGEIINLEIHIGNGGEITGELGVAGEPASRLELEFRAINQ